MADTWIAADIRNITIPGVGDVTVTRFRPRSGDGRHQLTFPDGTIIDILPDGVTTGAHRARTFGKALEDLGVTVDPATYVVGALVRAGATGIDVKEGL